MDTVYIKYIQGGGSSEAVNYAIECYKDRTVLFVVDNLDVQLNQVKERLIALGVPPEFIYCKTRIKQYRIGTPGILIVNKHPSNLNAAIHAISSVRENNLLILDEPDRDAVGHQDSDKIPKDKLVNKLRSLCGEVEHITASTLAQVVSKINYQHTIEIPKESGYLSFEDLKPVCLGDEDVGEMLRTGKLSPTLEKFIIRNASEGILIRVDRLVKDMDLIKKSLQKRVNVPVEVLNGTNRIDPKTFKGILITFQMGERGVTFPHLRHIIVDFSKTAFQNVVVQAFRNLGYGKISKRQNEYAGNSFSIERAKTAFEIENKLQKIMRLHHNNHKKRWKKVQELEFEYKWQLLGKSNKFKMIELEFKQITEIPYSKAVEEGLIETGELNYTIVKGNGEWYKGGGRSREKAIRDIINNAPHSPSWLDKAEVQKISPKYAVKRLKDKKEIENQQTQWGFIFDPKTGEPIKLVLWKKMEEDSPKFQYTRRFGVKTNSG